MPVVACTRSRAQCAHEARQWRRRRRQRSRRTPDARASAAGAGAGAEAARGGRQPKGGDLSATVADDERLATLRAQSGARWAVRRARARPPALVGDDDDGEVDPTRLTLRAEAIPSAGGGAADGDDVPAVAALLTAAFSADPAASGTPPAALAAMGGDALQRYGAQVAASIRGKMLILSQVSDYVLLVAEDGEGDEGGSSGDIVGTVDMVLTRAGGGGADSSDASDSGSRGRDGTDAPAPADSELWSYLGLRAERDWVGVVTSMAVAPRARRLGVASALLEGAEALAIAHCEERVEESRRERLRAGIAPSVAIDDDSDGATLVLALYVMEDNTGARALYREHDYIELGEAPVAPAPEAANASAAHERAPPRLLMVKKLV